MSWELTSKGKRTLQFEDEEIEKYLSIVKSKDKYHVILEDLVVPTDTETHMNLTKEEVVEFLNFDPWKN